jgi:hypothetical protein
VTKSAGAAIDALAAHPQTTFVADAARAAMTHAITLGGYLAAGFLLIGLAATALIPSAPLTEIAPTRPSTTGPPRHRKR